RIAPQRGRADRLPACSRRAPEARRSAGAARSNGPSAPPEREKRPIVTVPGWANLRGTGVSEPDTLAGSPQPVRRSSMKRLLTSTALSLVAAAAWAASPPASRTAPVTETVQGAEIVDPYRWLEGDLTDPKSMGKVTPEVGAWTDAQNAYTRSVLD